MESKLILGDCSEKLKEIDSGSVNLTITSPPYDNLRTYDNSLDWSFDVFKKVADELYRVTCEGGVVIWVVGDATINGSETLSSFKQAIYFNQIGFNVHDTMLYKKINHLPLTQNRYEQDFEYMFCFSKGRPNVFTPIRIACKYAGTVPWGASSVFKTPDERVLVEMDVIKDTKIHGNIFEYRTGSTENDGFDHPAPFPKGLVEDQMNTWSNEGDVVLDPFMGSGTTGIVCAELNRNFIGIEKVPEYFNGAEHRVLQSMELHKYRKTHLF